jgi:hypothetical protein
LTGELDDKLELLIRKYTSDADFGVAGKVQLIWLTPELLDGLVEKYGREQKKSLLEVRALKGAVKKNLEADKAVAFLMIVRPEKDAFIGQPDWNKDGGSPHPYVILRGTGNRVSIPYKWDQILGEGKFMWYSKVASGYLLYKAHAADGQILIDPSDLSFSVQVYTVAKSPRNNKYDVYAEFHYKLVPVPLQSMVDSSIPSWNDALVEMTPLNEYGRPETGSQNERVASLQSSSTNLSRSEILQIVGLGIAFAQFIAAL